MTNGERMDREVVWDRTMAGAESMRRHRRHGRSIVVSRAAEGYRAHVVGEAGVEATYRIATDDLGAFLVEQATGHGRPNEPDDVFEPTFVLTVGEGLLGTPSPPPPHPIRDATLRLALFRNYARLTAELSHLAVQQELCDDPADTAEVE